MSFQLPETIVDRLLELLSQDDDFRAEFTSNPRQALASLGYAPAADPDTQAGIWMCLKTPKLASKETIGATLAVLRVQLTSIRPTFNPIGLGMTGPDFQPKARRTETVHS